MSDILTNKNTESGGIINWQSAREFLGKDANLGGIIVSSPEMPSTQIEAKKAALNGARHGTAFVTDYQSAGRGRRDRSWSARPRLDLTFSVVLRSEIEPCFMPFFNFAAALSVCETLTACLSAQNGAVSIKWPNDVLVSGKKICGIICETVGTGNRPDCAALGIGVNVNGTSAELPSVTSGKPQVTSLFLECGRIFDLPRLLALILTALSKYVPLNSDESGRARLIALYRENCSTLGTEVKVITDEGEFSGVASDISDDGAIVVSLENGSAASYLAADVVHLRPAKRNAD